MVFMHPPAGGHRGDPHIVTELSFLSSLGMDELRQSQRL